MKQRKHQKGFTNRELDINEIEKKYARIKLRVAKG